mmetsp:Transcript_75783/g.209135  ORF Transcript_75783/g.209135 Transcript_75783/m.209135 type:complete len:252 (+) Transcript_75783:595-1350(+)
MDLDIVLQPIKVSHRVLDEEHRVDLANQHLAHEHKHQVKHRPNRVDAHNHPCNAGILLSHCIDLLLPQALELPEARQDLVVRVAHRNVPGADLRELRVLRGAPARDPPGGPAHPQPVNLARLPGLGLGVALRHVNLLAILHLLFVGRHHGVDDPEDEEEAEAGEGPHDGAGRESGVLGHLLRRRHRLPEAGEHQDVALARILPLAGLGLRQVANQLRYLAAHDHVTEVRLDAGTVAPFAFQRRPYARVVRI